MALFQNLYNKVLHWSKHQHAPYYLAGVSFIESSVFPIPPDVMLIPMILTKPLLAWRFAFITTLASILGSFLGYALGFYAYEMLAEPFVQAMGYQAVYEKAVSWFKHYGFYAVLIAGFTPIPYKLFTIAAGATQMLLLPFLIAAIIGRAIRFYLVTALIRLLGPKLELILAKYVDKIAWVSIGLIALFIAYKTYS